MRIGILTWHKALNHGAILQAYSSQKVLERISDKVVILDYNRKVVDKRSYSEKIRHIFHLITSGEIFIRKKIKSFDKEKRLILDKFITDELNTGAVWNKEETDAVMIGSDMVFNIKQGYCPYMYGIGVKSKKIFSYAACSGGTVIQTCKSFGVTDEVRKALRKFYGISCRDITTTEFVKELTGRQDIIENIDPVLLYGFLVERKLWNTGKWEKNKYILIYAYHENMNSSEEIREIKKISKKTDCKIVSVGYFHSWADINVNADPKEFIELFSNASYVITDTFHGTVFSLIFERNFVSIIRNNAFKLEYLLKQCHMENRIARKNSEIYSKLYNKPQYELYNKWISQERERSTEYLTRMVN